jgi:hypothetical protein
MQSLAAIVEHISPAFYSKSNMFASTDGEEPEIDRSGLQRDVRMSCHFDCISVHFRYLQFTLCFWQDLNPEIVREMARYYNLTEEAIKAQILLVRRERDTKGLEIT